MSKLAEKSDELRMGTQSIYKKARRIRLDAERNNTLFAGAVFGCMMLMFLVASIML